MTTTAVVTKPARRPIYGFFLAPLFLLLVWLANGNLVPAGLQPRSAQLKGLITTFLGIFIEALPFLMAGVIASIAIKRWVTPARLSRLAGKSSVGGALKGSLFGMLFPVCECGAIPASRRLLSQGAPAPMGIAFALAAPVVNPVVLISTMVAFADWRWAAGRVGLTIIIAMIIGLIVGAGLPRESILSQNTLRGDDGHDDHHDTVDHDHEHHEHCDHGDKPETWRSMMSHGSAEFFEMLQYLVIGGLLAATMQTFVPTGMLLSFSQNGAFGMLGPLISILILMGVAVLLSVCSTVDAFLALAFLSLVHPGAVMAFLVFGPMIDIKSGLMLLSTFSRRAVVAIILLAVQLTLVAGLAMFILVG
jgi:uncharacterized membrane protein YraQ (UPF0718 family)